MTMVLATAAQTAASTGGLEWLIVPAVIVLCLFAVVGTIFGLSAFGVDNKPKKYQAQNDTFLLWGLVLIFLAFITGGGKRR